VLVFQETIIFLFFRKNQKKESIGKQRKIFVLAKEKCFLDSWDQNLNFQKEKVIACESKSA